MGDDPFSEMCEVCEKREAEVACWSYTLNETFQYCDPCAVRKLNEFPDLIVVQ